MSPVFILVVQALAHPLRQLVYKAEHTVVAAGLVPGRVRVVAKDRVPVGPGHLVLADLEVVRDRDRVLDLVRLVALLGGRGRRSHGELTRPQGAPLVEAAQGGDGVRYRRTTPDQSDGAAVP